MTADTPRLRLSIVGVITLSLFLAMFARLYYLQVLDHESYRVAAETNQVRIVREPAPRGRILDREGRVLVDNRPSTVVTVDRSELRSLSTQQREVLLARLARTLGEPVSVLERRLADVRVSPVVPVAVARDVDPTVVTRIRENQEAFPAVAVRQEAVRTYPHGMVAAHVLGYIGEINADELEARRDRDYRGGDLIGKAGVELMYEDDLRGRSGIRKLEVDSRGRVLRDLGERAPVQGNDLRLSIDLDLQVLAEQTLADALGAARTRGDHNRRPFVAPAGAAVVLDVTDGSVLAMASHPTYDPSRFVGGITQAEFAALIDEAHHAPFTNRAVQGQYPPGSTFKLVTSVAGLRSGVINRNTTINDTGLFVIPNCRGESCRFRNAGGRSHGPVDVVRALTVSSNVFYYNIGSQLWERRGLIGDLIQQTAREFGMGERTGVPLGSESGGLVLDPDAFQQRHEANPVAFPEGQWRVGMNANLAIGEAVVLVTPLQLANAYAAFANGGTLFTPAVARDVRTQGGEVVRQLAPRVIRTIDLPPEIRDPIHQGLVNAVAASSGTAAAAFAGFPLQSYPVAGKTGTGQVPGKQDNALFVAYAPANEPRYAVAVVMEEAGFGGSAAAPVARRLLEHLAGLIDEPGDVEPVELVQGVPD